MAYNKGLNLVTGRGGQTIDVLKTRSAGYDAYIDGVVKNTGAIDKSFSKVVVIADGTSNTLTANIPDGTRELYCQLEVAAGATTSSGQIFVGNNIQIMSAANVIITSDKHFWSPRLLSFTDGEKIYRYSEYCLPSTFSALNASLQGSTRYIELNEIGTISFILTTANVNYTEGDTLTIFYR